MKKKILLLLPIVSFLAGCQNQTGSFSNAVSDLITPATTVVAGNQDASVEVWSTSVNNKVMKDYNIDSIVHEQAKINITACKNEYESAQIIISTKNCNVSNYNVVLNDLHLEGDSSTVYNKNSVALYNQGYIKVTTITNTIPMPLGSYPDALIPFEKAVEYKDNHVDSGNNQGIYYSFYIPKDQKAGHYSGSFSLVIDGKTTEIPVSLNVLDFDISDKRSNKAIFRVSGYYTQGELDDSQLMLDKYNDALAEFRLCTGNMLNANTHSDDDIAYFAEKAAQYAQDDKYSTIVLPYRETTTNGERDLNTEVMKKYLRALVNKSYEINCNILKKCVAYFTMIDEPYLQNTWSRARLVTQSFNNCISSMASEIGSSETTNTQLRAELAESCRKIPNVLTNKFSENLDGLYTTWCPHIDDYNTQEQRDLYKDLNERWFYCCTNPKNPYPTYHIDDYLVSSRLMPWMQAEYDVTGSLLWATDLYVSYRNSQYVDIEDFMQTADRYPSANGDGFLFYPGKVYGMNEPITSIRLHSLRDGYEEYEILLNIMKKYKAIIQAYGDNSLSSEKVLSSIYRKLYNGTRVSTTVDIFDKCRSTVLDLYGLTMSDCYIVDYEATKLDATYKILAKNDVTLNVPNAEKTILSSKNGYILYSFKKNFGNQKNYFEFEATQNGITRSYNQYIGGPINKISTSNYTVTVDRGSTSVVSGSSFDYDHNLINLNFPNNSTKKATHNANISIDYSNINLKEVDRMEIEVYNSGPEKIFDIRFKYSKQSLKYVVLNGTLKHGKNVISIPNLYGYNWNSYGTITDMYLYVGEEKEAANSNFYLGDIYFFML